MPAPDKPLKNSLNIKLAESAIFLRTNDTTGRNRYNDSRPTMLRGLLTLELVKPTRISNIYLELQAKSALAWPEGFGAQRTDVSEVHKVFSASEVVFKAGSSRKSASVGPGIALEDVSFEGSDDSHTSTPRNPRSLRATSPGVESLRTVDSDRTSRRSGRTARRLSADAWSRITRNSSLQRNEVPELPASPIPPYTPSILSLGISSPAPPYTSSPPTSPPPTPSLSSEHPVSRLSTQNLTSLNEDISPIYEESRIGFKSAVHEEHRSQRSHLFSRNRSSVSTRPLRSRSRRPSVDDVPEIEHEPENEAGPSNSSSVAPGSSSGHTDEPPPSPIRARGRRSRFSLSSVSNKILDVVRSHSSRGRDSSLAFSSRERNGSRLSFKSTETSPRAPSFSIRRGRTRENEKDVPSRSPSRFRDASPSQIPTTPQSPVFSVTDGRAPSRQGSDRISFSMFGGRVEGEQDRKLEGDGWKEFKKGTYTYPICFQIPGHAPPSLSCNYGSVTWRIKASVHRPGAFSSRMSTQREVLVISCPCEEDTEDTENIIVERHWDQQLQYLISISGRCFYVGGTIPVSFTLLPLAKIKVYRISVVVEEKVEYHTQFKRVARTDPITTMPLLSLREEGKDARQILPLESDDEDALTKSPVYKVVDQSEEPSELASTLMGPGPWTFHQDLALPISCKSMHATNRNKRSNITITHTLKCVMRVERGDDTAVDPKTGKRKLYDIVVQTPVQILSCRCNPDWTALPHYSENLEDPASIAPQCPCEARSRMSLSERQPTSPRAVGLERSSSDSSASHAESSPIPISMASLRNWDNLLLRNSQFERLVSGQESEVGEAPPAYTTAIVGNKVAYTTAEGVVDVLAVVG